MAFMLTVSSTVATSPSLKLSAPVPLPLLMPEAALVPPIPEALLMPLMPEEPLMPLMPLIPEALLILLPAAEEEAVSSRSVSSSTVRFFSSGRAMTTSMDCPFSVRLP